MGTEMTPPETETGAAFVAGVAAAEADQAGQLAAEAEAEAETAVAVAVTAADQAAAAAAAADAAGAEAWDARQAVADLDTRLSDQLAAIGAQLANLAAAATPPAASGDGDGPPPPEAVGSEQVSESPKDDGPAETPSDGRDGPKKPKRDSYGAGWFFKR